MEPHSANDQDRYYNVPSSLEHQTSSDSFAASGLLPKQHNWANVEKPTPLEHSSRTIPSPLPRSQTDIVFTIVVDIVLILAAALFFVLAIVAIKLNGRPVGDQLGNVVEEAMKLGPTIFPIVFAGLVSRTLKSLGRYWAERGAKLGTLWQLMNVHTMFEAVLSPFTLREVSILPVLLLMLWALSPLGGQAVLRLVYHRNETTVESVPIRYLDLGPGGSMVVNGYYAQVLNAQVPLPVQYAFGASVLQNLDIKKGPQDNWSNVKIPRIEALDQSLTDNNGWIDIPMNSSRVESYSSLMGVPIVGLPRKGSARFPLESSYVSLSCDPTTVQINGSLNKGMVVECVDCNYTWPAGPGLDDTRLQIFLGREPSASEKANSTLMAPRRITLSSGSGSTSDETPANITTVTTCSVTQSLVETDISCERGSCAAKRIRRSTTDLRNSNFTIMDHWGIWVLEQISTQFTGSELVAQTSNMIEYFLNDSSKLPVVQISATNLAANKTRVDLTKVPTDQLAARFTLVANTYFQLLHAPTAFAGNLPAADLDLYGRAHVPADGLRWISDSIYGPCNQTASAAPGDCYPVDVQILRDTPFYGAAADATVTHTAVVFRPDWAWVAVLLLASSVLMGTHVAGVVLGLRTRAPDVFDPVIALTYDNNYLGDVAELQRVHTLRASERVRLLSRVKVRLGDVQGGLEVGKVALGAAGGVFPLGRDRVYE